MARSSKIICILILCACLTALCAVSAFAEPVELSTFETFACYGVYTNDPVLSTDTMYFADWANIPANGSPIFQTGGTANHSRYCLFGPCAEFVGVDEFTPLYFQSEYTYNITFVFQFLTSFYINGTQSQGSIPQQVVGLYLTPLISHSANQGVQYPFGDFVNILGNFNFVEGAASFTLLDDDTSSSTANFSKHIYTVQIDVVFRLNELFEFDDFCGVLPLLTVLPPTGTVGSNNSTSVYRNVFVSCTATEDSEGEVIDEEINEIVQGQKDAVVFGQDREYGIVFDNGDSSEALTDARTVLGLSDYATALNSLASSMVYQGTDFSFTFPAAENVPYLGNLWTSFSIPLKQWIDSMPPTYITILRFLAWLGLLFSAVYLIRSTIDDFNGGEH